ncbi:hypothetical protein [uncultured Sphaerotilus sp.]
MRLASLPFATLLFTSTLAACGGGTSDPVVAFGPFSWKRVKPL